jgi:hypothetical protein
MKNLVDDTIEALEKTGKPLFRFTGKHPEVKKLQGHLRESQAFQSFEAKHVGTSRTIMSFFGLIDPFQECELNLGRRLFELTSKPIDSLKGDLMMFENPGSHPPISEIESKLHGTLYLGVVLDWSGRGNIEEIIDEVQKILTTAPQSESEMVFAEEFGRSLVMYIHRSLKETNELEDFKRIQHSILLLAKSLKGVLQRHIELDLKYTNP